MRLTLIILLAIAMTGCASIKQQCEEDQWSAHSEYSSYQECMADKRARQERRAQAWSDSFKGVGQTSNNNMNCTQVIGSYPTQYSCH